MFHSHRGDVGVHVILRQHGYKPTVGPNVWSRLPDEINSDDTDTDTVEPTEQPQQPQQTEQPQTEQPVDGDRVTKSQAAAIADKRAKKLAELRTSEDK